jgi:hypothetical protein
MKRFPLISAFLSLIVLAGSVTAQSASQPYKSQETSEVDGIPVIVKHLPNWETVKATAKVTDKIADVKQQVTHPVVDVIELAGGAEAATAVYPEGTLLLVEFPTPQSSSSADAAITGKLAGSSDVIYRRIGNYNALFFPTGDAAAANALLDQIQYQKSVQWLGEDPFLLQKFERYIANTGRDVAFGTIFFILGVFATAILIGVGVGYMYFRYRTQQRAALRNFSDAGGLTRLNLDELSD